MTAETWLKHASSNLSSISSAQLDAELLLSNRLKQSRSQLLSNLDQELTNDQITRLNADLLRRTNGRPIAYIIGSIEFYGIKLSIDERVLCPRPETETLVTRIIKTTQKSAKVIDVGTGSGAIAVALKKARPDLSVIGSDFSNDALTVARNNIAEQQLDIEVFQNNLLDDLNDDIDVVVANLPYLPDDESLDESVQAEPREALVSGENGLQHYRKLFEQAANRTAIKAILIEALPSQTKQLSKIALKNGFSLAWSDNYSFEFNRT